MTMSADDSAPVEAPEPCEFCGDGPCCGCAKSHVVAPVEAPERPDAQTLAKLTEWMQVSHADGFGFLYCCETALENGLTYEVLTALLADLARAERALHQIADRHPDSKHGEHPAVDIAREALAVSVPTEAGTPQVLGDACASSGEGS